MWQRDIWSAGLWSSETFSDVAGWNVDIIYVNKLFSTLKNHNLEDDFFTRFKEDLETLPTDSYIVFNDINYQNMGRDKFNNFITKEGFSVIGKYFFNIDGAYTGNYTSIPTNINICNIPDDLSDVLNDHSFEPKTTPNKTVFFLYQKQ